MKRNLFARILFAISAVYDGVLGAAFLLAPAVVYEWFKVPEPDHWGYVQFPAAILIVFALMFVAIAVRPVRNRNLIPFGALLKIAYAGVVGFHWFTAGLPDMWKPFVVCDVVFLILFVVAYIQLGRGKPATATAA